MVIITSKVQTVIHKTVTKNSHQTSQYKNSHLSRLMIIPNTKCKQKQELASNKPPVIEELKKTLKINHLYASATKPNTIQTRIQKTP